jgi:hypothetical protein
MRIFHSEQAKDGVLCLAIFAATVLYLAALPRSLQPADEAYFLLESKRILNGEVFYKDVFYYSLPAAHWVMAFVFWMFGTDIRTAKLLMAVLHGLTGVFAFLTARRLGVRRGIACCLPLAYVGLCWAAWPVASPHWFSTFLMAVLLFMLTGKAWARRAASAFGPGVLTGVLTSVQHQKGIVVAAGVCGLFVLDCALGRRYAERCSPSDLLRRLLYFGAGASIVLIPVILVVLGTAGRDPFVDAILWTVRGGKYREYNHPSWGAIGLHTALALYTLPVVLKYAALVVGIGILRTLHAWTWRTDRTEFGKVLILTVFTAASVVSVAYNADFIHLAFAALFCFILLAETLEAWIQRANVFGYSGVVVKLLVAGLASGLVFHLYSNAIRAWQEHPYPHETAFGHVDFANREEIRLVERIRALLRGVGSHEFFAYPVYTSLYLMTGADNPTPYQLLIPGFNLPQHVDRALAILEAKRLPYLFATDLFLKPNDVILNYIHQHYECVDPGQKKCALFRKRGDESPRLNAAR